MQARRPESPVQGESLQGENCSTPPPLPIPEVGNDDEDFQSPLVSARQAPTTDTSPVQVAIGFSLLEREAIAASEGPGTFLLDSPVAEEVDDALSMDEDYKKAETPTSEDASSVVEDGHMEKVQGQRGDPAPVVVNKGWTDDSDDGHDGAVGILCDSGAAVGISDGEGNLAVFPSIDAAPGDSSEEVHCSRPTKLRKVDNIPGMYVHRVTRRLVHEETVFKMEDGEAERIMETEGLDLICTGHVKRRYVFSPEEMTCPPFTPLWDVETADTNSGLGCGAHLTAVRRSNSSSAGLAEPSSSRQEGAGDVSN